MSMCVSMNVYVCKHSATLQTAHILTAVFNQVVMCPAEWTGASRRERKCPSLETAAKAIRTLALSAERTLGSWVRSSHRT